MNSSNSYLLLHNFKEQIYDYAQSELAYFFVEL